MSSPDRRSAFAKRALEREIGFLAGLGKGFPHRLDRLVGILAGLRQGAAHGVSGLVRALFGFRKHATDIGEGRLHALAQIARDLVRAMFGAIEGALDHAAERAHGVFDFFRALDETDRKALQRAFALLKGRDEVGLRRGQKLRGLSQHLGVLVEAADDAAHLRQRMA